MGKKKPFLTDLFVGLALTALVVWLNLETEYPWTQRLCDGCFVAAVMLLGVGGIQFAANHGTFDIMSFGIRSVFHLKVPAAAPRDDEKEDFLAYREHKAEKRKSPKAILLAGLVYLVLALIFLAAYLATN